MAQDGNIPLRRLIKEQSATLIRADAALTDTYVAATVHDVGRFGAVAIIGDYDPGDETDVQIQIEYGYDVAGTLAYALNTTAGAPSSGESELTKNIINLTPASFTATGDVLVLGVLDVGCFKSLRVSAKAVGGTPTGTLALWAVGGAL